MGGIRTGGSKIRFKKARTNRGQCNKCHKPITPGQSYISGVGGSRIRRSGVAHKNCY